MSRPDIIAANRLRGSSMLSSSDMDEPRKRFAAMRSEEHTSELQSRSDLVCRLLLEKKKKKTTNPKIKATHKTDPHTVYKAGIRPAIIYKVNIHTRVFIEVHVRSVCLATLGTKINTK